MSAPDRADTSMHVHTPNFASKSKSILCLLTLTFLSTPAWAQTQLGTLFGTITDTTGAVLPGVKVTVLSVGTGLKREAATDMGGQYLLVGLPIGKYNVRLQKEGFQTEVREGIAVSGSATIAINVSLGVGKVTEQTTATANVVAVDNATSTVSGFIPEQSLTELPLNGRDLRYCFDCEVWCLPDSCPQLPVVR